MELKLFEKNIGPFLQMIPVETDENFQLNEEMLSKETDLINKLNKFDESITKIINDKLKREDAGNIIKAIKDLIDFETNEVSRLRSYLVKLNIDSGKELMDSKTNRIHLILRFLQEQKIKIDNARKNIYEKYEKYLNILIIEAEQYKNYLGDYLTENSNLFEEWVKIVSKEKRYEEKYLNFDVLLDNFLDLLNSIQIDIDYCYDEKFILWTIQNKFSKYLK